MLFALLEMLGRRYDFTLDDPVQSISEEGMNAILYGDSEPLTVDLTEFANAGGKRLVSWDGMAEWIGRNFDEDSKRGEKWREQFLVYKPCSVCGGSRLRSEALQFRIGGRNIAEVSAMSISDFADWMSRIEEHFTEKERKIAQEVVKEIRERLRFLIEVGLGYLSLSRSSRSLSGGESQRIRLATQVGSKLVNVLYILDEPSIGLHQRDNRRLIRSLQELRDAGNSVIVVEHDEEMMRSADWIVDVGPKAGRKGGHVVASGTFDDILRSDSVTADYLTGRRRIEVPATLREGNGRHIVLRGASGNNLKHIDVDFPLGKLILVTGVSGSGKSTLVNETLRPILSRKLYRSLDRPLPYDSIEGIEHVDKLVVVDQSPIGRTPRSNPATYSNVFADIRKLFEMTPDAQVRGFKAGRFSFNVKGGRCETCRGAGVQTIEMNFLPDVYVTCKSCGGHRYNRETLEVKYKGKNIDDVLNMTVNMAVEFFENIPVDLPEAACHSGGGVGLPDARPALHDALGRRVAAHQAGRRTLETRYGQHALYPRRADYGAPFRGYPPVDRRAEQAGRPRKHGRRHRTQPRRGEGRRLDHRYRSRRRCGGRTGARGGYAARGGRRRAELYGTFSAANGALTGL